MFNKMIIGLLLLNSFSSFADSSQVSAREFVLSKKSIIENLLYKSIRLKSKIIFKTLNCLESEGFGEARFGVATCLVDFVDSKGGGKIAVNISSDETGSLEGKEISVVLLSTWD
jgi:hypothetical protein